MSRVIFFIGLLAFSLSYSQSFDIEKDRYSWYENFIDIPELREEMEHMDDQLLGKHVNTELRGLILDMHSGKPVAGAVVKIYNSQNQLVQETVSGKIGYYLFRNINTERETFTVCVKVSGYASLTRTISFYNHFYGLDIYLVPASSQIIYEPQTIKINDPLKKAELTVPCDILQRIDHQPVRYPIKISFSYIDPERNLPAMPGFEMLSQERGSIMRPLLSSGAVLVEGFDKDLVPLRISRDKEAKLKKTTLLKINVPDFIAQKNIEQIQFWSYDPLKSISWNPFPKVNSLMRQNPREEILSVNFLQSYVLDVMKRILNNPEVKLRACFNNSLPDYAQDIRKNQNISPSDLFTSLLSFIYSDLNLLLASRNEKPVSCFSQKSDSDQSYYLDPSAAFDLKYKNRWYQALEYKNCPPGSDYSVYFYRPYLLSKDFDYTPLLKIRESICTLLQKERWDKVFSVESVDLIPFNLDIPTQAVPVSFEFFEKSGDGKFEVSLQAQTDKGNYAVSRLIYSPGKPVKVNFLLPEVSRIKVFVKREYHEPGLKFLKEVFILKPAVLKQYQWDSRKSRIVSIMGEEPDWMKQPLIEF